MRDRERLELTVEEWHDARRAERQRLLAQVLAILRRARENREPWYVWVLERRDRQAGELESRDEPQGSLL